MKHVLLLSLFFWATACYENQDSSSDDAGGLTINPGDSAQFIAAKTLFAGSCAGGGCHSDFSSKTEAQFVAQGFVVPGDPDSSTVYCRLQGSTGACGGDPKNMPLGQPALDSSELLIVSDWINTVSP